MYSRPPGLNLAWPVFTKGIDRDSARSQIHIEGNPALGEKVLQMTAIVGAVLRRSAIKG